MSGVKIPKPYFHNVPDIGDLNFEYCLYEYIVPVLFICKDNHGNFYLCSCCDIFSEQKWLIVPVNIKVLFDLFENKITLRKIFERQQSLGYTAVWQEGWTEEQINKVDSFDEQDLPEDDYLDMEEDEYKEFKDRISNVTKVENVENKNSIQSYTIVDSNYYNRELKIEMKKVHKKDLLKKREYIQEYIDDFINHIDECRFTINISADTQKLFNDFICIKNSENIDYEIPECSSRSLCLDSGVINEPQKAYSIAIAA